MSKWGRRKKDNQPYPKGGRSVPVTGDRPETIEPPTLVGQVKGEKVVFGQCYDYTHKRALRAVVDNEHIVIVHAKVQFWDDPPYDHAWVETEDGLVQDWQTMEQGTSKFAGVGWDKETFYQTYKPTAITRYSPKEIVENTQRYGHTGPWNDD